MGSQTAVGLAALRLELKAWEKSFAAENGGRKAGREDIKKDVVIAAKYKEYDRLRRPASTSQRVSPKKITVSRDMEQVPVPTTAPLLGQHTSTPRKRKLTSPERVLPSPAREPSPTPQAIRQRLGPTPQKDGQILSLFDGLFSSTPSKASDRDALGLIDANVAATPSKAIKFNIAASPGAENARLSRTPQSSGKRYMLDTFATPMKRKHEDVACTPSSGRGLMRTPSFLRRSTTDFMSNLDPLAEDEDPEVAGLRMPPFKKRGVVRSLSSIIRNLRDQVEETLDDDLELMREMEAEEEGRPYERPQTKKIDLVPEIMVEDSQVDMPLGPDQGNDSEEDEADPRDGLDHEGRPRKVWKKKGLKRQTRRVIMRPVLHKAPTQEPLPDVHEDYNDPVLETQVQTQYFDDHDENEDPAGVADQNFGFDDETTAKNSGRSNQTQKDNSTLPKVKEPDQDGIVKRAVKKVSATAHANFKKLKIRNKNSKASGKGGRFGRRR